MIALKTHIDLGLVHLCSMLDNTWSFCAAEKMRMTSAEMMPKFCCLLACSSILVVMILMFTSVTRTTEKNNFKIPSSRG